MLRQQLLDTSRGRIVTLLGAVTTYVKGNGGYVIRGAGCPLAALTGKHRVACLAMESLLGEVLGGEVNECCDRKARPKCCFKINVRDRIR